MKPHAAILLLCTLATAAEPWRMALPGWRYEWPRDHAAHAGFKTEWWYFTGELRADNGRRFGYQLTFFRQGVRPPDSPRAASRFVRDDFSFAHFALTDVDAGRFHFAQRLSRGAFGEAGFGEGKTEPRLAWLDGWELTLDADGAMRIRADEAGRTLTLSLRPAKPLVIHGHDGVSRKSTAGTHASHYYSATRLAASGTLSISGRTFAVNGTSWLDREWSSHPLADDLAGWDWLSAQFDDGTELMLYRLRRRDGSVDAASSGTFVFGDGKTRHLRNDEIEMTPVRRWRSGQSGGEYPIEWRVRIPALALELHITTPLETQELLLQPVTYWEGLVDITGTRNGSPAKAHGYLEMTGYAGDIPGLRAGNSASK